MTALTMAALAMAMEWHFRLLKDRKAEGKGNGKRISKPLDVYTSLDNSEAILENVEQSSRSQAQPSRS